MHEQDYCSDLVISNRKGFQAINISCSSKPGRAVKQVLGIVRKRNYEHMSSGMQTTHLLSAFRQHQNRFTLTVEDEPRIVYPKFLVKRCASLSTSQLVTFGCELSSEETSLLLLRDREIPSIKLYLSYEYLSIVFACGGHR